MQFKSALAIFALCSVVVKAAPIVSSFRLLLRVISDNWVLQNWESVELVERDFDNELEARFSDLLLEELESREWDDELEVRSERAPHVVRHPAPLLI